MLPDTHRAAIRPRRTNAWRAAVDPTREGKEPDRDARRHPERPTVPGREPISAGGCSRFARMGLEHEFFLVDRSGEPRDLADLFLLECREAARAKGLDPRCFKAESVKSLVEITTPPSSGLGEMASELPGQSRAGAGGRVGAGSRPVSFRDLSPPDKARAPRRSRLQGQG